MFCKLAEALGDLRLIPVSGETGGLLAGGIVSSPLSSVIPVRRASLPHFGHFTASIAIVSSLSLR